MIVKAFLICAAALTVVTAEPCSADAQHATAQPIEAQSPTAQPAAAQDIPPSPAAVPECNCREHFDWVKSTFEENDAGFGYVLEKKGQAAYDLHNALALEKVDAANTHGDCRQALQEWLRFFRRGHIALGYLSPTAKLEPDRNAPPTAEQLAERASRFFVEKINETTLYMRIPSFMRWAKPIIDSVVDRNRELILSTENLIIDLRGNGGGADYSWDELTPFLYTNPVRNLRVEFLSTPLNNEYWAKVRIDKEDDEDSWSRRILDSLEANPGKFYNPWGEKATVSRQDTVHRYPANVGVIVDEMCGSSTEEFLLHARQSMKVKLFGVQTYGALDISNVTEVDSPDGLYRLVYATSRALWLPDMVIDDIGIQPDFYLGDMPREDWRDYTSDILNAR